MESLFLLVAASAWNGEKDEDPGRNRDIEGDDDELIGISFGAFRIIVGGLNAATKSELPPPPKKDDDSISQSNCIANRTTTVDLDRTVEIELCEDHGRSQMAMQLPCEEDEGGAETRETSAEEAGTDYQYRHSYIGPISQYWYRIYGAEDLFALALAEMMMSLLVALAAMIYENYNQQYNTLPLRCVVLRCLCLAAASR